MARYKKIKAATSININDSEELDFDERLVRDLQSFAHQTIENLQNTEYADLRSGK